MNGDTKILTNNGWVPIKYFENIKIFIWDGSTFQKAVVKKTGTNQKILEIKFSNGRTILCSPYHKFLVRQKENIPESRPIDLSDNSQNNTVNVNSVKNTTIIAKKLQEGTEICHYDFPLIKDGEDKLSMAYYNGYNNIKEEIPYNGNIKTKIEWLKGFLDRNGKLGTADSKGINSLNFTNMHNKFSLGNMQDVQLLLMSLGIHCSLVRIGVKTRQQKIIYEIQISLGQLRKLLDIGLKLKKYNLADIPYASPENEFIYKIVSIKEYSKTLDTYCVNMESGKIMAEGIVTGI